jgi:hypothetical protein
LPIPSHRFEVPGREIFETLALGSRSLTSFFRFLGVILSPSGLSRTFGGQSAARTGEGEDYWAMKNDRRVFLINRKYQTGLNPTETAELAQLQAAIAGHTNALAPLPLQALEALEAHARQLEQRAGQQPEG